MGLSPRMPDIKLTYFDLRARGETARLILAYAGAQYDDDRIEHGSATWVAMKASGSLRYDQLPRLTVDGTEIYQSMAICRYLAKEFGLGGANNLENAQIDEVVDALEDLFSEFAKVIKAQDPAEKEERMKAAVGVAAPNTLARLEKCLAARGGQFFAGNKLSWADLHLTNMMDIMGDLAPNTQLLESAPRLASLVERTRSLPNISTWLHTRPDTPF